MPLPLQRIEQESAVRADCESGRDNGLTLRPGFDQSGAFLANDGLLDLNRIDRPVPPNAAAEVENKTIMPAGMKPKSAADHLVMQHRRHTWPEQHDGIDARRIKTCGHYADVNKLLELPGLEACDRRMPIRCWCRAVDETAFDPHARL